MKTNHSEDFFSRLLSLHNGMNGAEFCRFIGISTPLYQKWKNGAVPGYDKLKLISEKTGKSVDWLLTGRETPAVDPHSRDNILASLADAHDRLRGRPGGERMVGWVATAMLEATEALRFFDEGKTQEAYARAYKAQRIFGRIFRSGFDEQ